MRLLKRLRVPRSSRGPRIGGLLAASAAAVLLACRRPIRMAVLPPPASAPLARSPSTSPDRWPQMAPTVSILSEPVERPLERYLYKHDDHFKRSVPDWELQYRTAEQQFLYKGEFSLFVREITDDGALVQDAVTGVAGFVPRSHFGDQEPALGALIHGARCIHMDVSVTASENIEALRGQTGIVFEWDDDRGEGYIMPTERQGAEKMYRVFRRDILWHDVYRLYIGQFVQFETVLPHEVPIEPNDEPNSPFALRVSSPEVLFSLLESYEEERQPRDDDGPDSTALTAPMKPGPIAFPALSGRPERPAAQSHPVLERWMTESPAGTAESPAWLWQPPVEYLADDEDEFAPIIPLQLKALRAPPPDIRIMAHEVALQRGDTWQEASKRQSIKDREKAKPPGRRKQEQMSQTVLKRKQAAWKRSDRQRKRRLASNRNF